MYSYFCFQHGYSIMNRKINYYLVYEGLFRFILIYLFYEFYSLESFGMIQVALKLNILLIYRYYQSHNGFRRETLHL